MADQTLGGVLTTIQNNTNNLPDVINGLTGTVGSLIDANNTVQQQLVKTQGAVASALQSTQDQQLAEAKKQRYIAIVGVALAAIGLFLNLKRRKK